MQPLKAVQSEFTDGQEVSCEIWVAFLHLRSLFALKSNEDN